MTCQELLGRWYELPAGLLGALALFVAIRRLSPQVDPAPAASVALALGGLVALVLILGLASSGRVLMAWVAPMPAIWLWLGAVVAGAFALFARAHGALCAWIGLGTAVLAVSPWVWLVVRLARNPW